ncbi:MAG TPA: hypothetical protein PLG94_14095 [Smithellaceae bacterium]|nr:hypothetical protein [Smithellaceae bacterium]HPL67658.1 hypothetical protein [Smithellaceae bacterium]
MSNPAVITLAELKHGIAGVNRMQIEDNIGEAIHLHMGPFRLDLTIKEFLALADNMRAALDATGRFTHYAVSQFDPLFLSECGPLLEHLTNITIEEQYIDDLRCIVYLSQRFGFYRFVPVTKTPAYRFLEDNDHSFLKYEQSSYRGLKNRERLMALENEIKKNDYPNAGRYIILFSGQNLVRDGQHRLAILRHLRGNVKIPVMVFRFSRQTKLPRIPWRACAGLPFHVARFIVNQLWKRLK